MMMTTDEERAMDAARTKALQVYDLNEEITDDFDADPISDAFLTAYKAGWIESRERAKARCTRPAVCTCDCGSVPMEPAQG